MRLPDVVTSVVKSVQPEPRIGCARTAPMPEPSVTLNVADFELPILCIIGWFA